MRATVLFVSTSLVIASGCVERVDPPGYGVYFPVVIAAQVHGVLDPSLPEVDLALVRPIVAGPELTPDFQRGTAPPFCMGFSFGNTRPPNLMNADAGEIIIEGLEASSFMDLSTGMPGELMELPSPLRCVRADSDGTSPYSCMPVTPLVMIPPGQMPWISNSTRVSIRMTGGAEVGELVERDIASPPPLMADFGLATLSRDDITVSWEATTAPFVMIEVLAQLRDGSERAQILCLERGDAARKQIPTEALALIPAPTAENPLIIQTSAAAIDVRSEYAGWGSYLVGIGRGEFAMSCHTPSGPCPAAPAM